MKIRKFFLVTVLIALFAALALGARAYASPQAKSFTVNNSVIDAPDANVWDDICETEAGNGVCTLRAALMQANRSAGADAVILQPGATYKLTIPTDPGGDTEATGDLNIREPVTLMGKGATIDANGGVTKGRGLTIAHSSTATPTQISLLTIKNGKPNDWGGGIFIYGAATMEYVTVSGSTAPDKGGGIYAYGPLTLNYVTVSGNTSLQNGGGIAQYHGDLTIANSIVDGNKATASGGGMLVDSDKFSLTNSTISANKAKDGGGLQLMSNTNSSITGSTIFGNNAEERGAGLLVFGNPGLAVVNSTISSNTAGSHGGGVYVSQSVLHLANTTITNNASNVNRDDIIVGVGGGVFEDASVVNLANTILAANFRAAESYLELDDCGGELQSLGYNLVQQLDDVCGMTGLTAGNVTGESPNLEPLASIGGTTKTHALKANSPAIDAGNPAGCVDPLNAVLKTDQRGYLRPVDGGVNGMRCDIGAFEYKSPGAPTKTPTATATNTATATPTKVVTNTPTATATSPANPCDNKPAAPQLAKPKANATVNSQKPKLNWNDITCATKYKVLVKRDAKGGLKVFKKKLTVSEVKTKMLEKGHDYYWRAKACNAAGCTKSVWSKFTIKP